MNTLISAKQLRSSLPDVVKKVRRGARFTVLYRSRPAFQVVPMGATEETPGDLDRESLYRAKAVGRSTDGHSAAEHDALLYGQ
jgi:antitoxin (DNA-binding transcriptional repressor) of toxin-antitoxin stability system